MFPKFLVACAALALAVAPSFAASPAPTPPADQRFPNTTIVKASADKLEVTTADGKDLTVAMTAATQIIHNRPGTVADIKASTFVGCTAVEGPDHKLHATEVHVFPESMRGVGEGHYPWPMDKPQADTTMTNGNIETMTGVSDGHVIKVSWKDPKTGKTGTIDIDIPPNVSVTVIEVVGKDMLKPGTKVSIRATPAADGSLTAKFVSVVS